MRFVRTFGEYRGQTTLASDSHTIARISASEGTRDRTTKDMVTEAFHSTVSVCPRLSRRAGSFVSETANHLNEGMVFGGILLLATGTLLGILVTVKPPEQHSDPRGV